jgi:TolA-binding protein
MSTPTTPAESKPSPWLTMAVPIVITLLGLAVQWGTLGADVRHLERRATAAEADLSRVAATQSNAAIQAGRLEEQLRALNSEIARLSRAVEKLTEKPTASR